MKFRVLIAGLFNTSSPANCFIPFARALGQAMIALGFEVAPPSGVDDGAIEIVLGLTEKTLELSPNAIIYNAEQIGTSPYWREIYREHTYWDFSKMNAARLVGRGASLVVHCPIGMHASMERVQQDLPPEVDVLFYGAMNDRRRRILDQLGRAGLVVRWLHGVYDHALDEQIARAKVVLNLHYYEGAAHEIFRTSHLFANKKCVVSEAGSDPDLDQIAQTCGIVVPYRDLAETCKQLVADQHRREAVALRGWAWFSQNTRLVLNVRQALISSGVALPKETL